MPKQIIESCCVRTHIETETGIKTNQGSGVIVKNSSTYFVLTAHHCIYGENGIYSNIEPSKIWIEKKKNMSSNFERINVISIIGGDQCSDWCILEIENPNIDCDFLRISLGRNLVKDDKVYFEGYQHLNNSSSRPWAGIIINVGENEFKIKLDNDTFSQNGIPGNSAAKGLSGSGVFIIRSNKLYLVGHLKSVIGEKALNSDIKCGDINCHFSNWDIAISDLTNIEELEDWNRLVEETATEADVAEWRKNNINEFNNLSRKSSVLLSEKEANDFIKSRLLSFLSFQKKMDKVEMYESYYKGLNVVANLFEERVKYKYSKKVDSKEIAINLLYQLEDDFNDFINKNNGTNNNLENLKYTAHKVTDWLMNCSFDFKKDE